MGKNSNQDAATIHDIASAAGVSPSTVSRILTGSARVSDKKRARVEEAIKTLNYRPNVIAQRLASGRSMAIGVLTENTTSLVFGEILNGIEKALEGTGYHHLFASSYHYSAGELGAIDMLIKQRVDGLIVVGGQIPDADLCHLAQQMPLVVVGRAVVGAENNVIQVENFQGAYQATHYLIELGHRRVAHITGRLPHSDSIARRDGYLKALRDAKIEPDPNLIIEGTFLEKSGLLAVEMLLTRAVSFSAIFAANDQMAYGARLALYRRGIRVPDDVSLVGFDDLPNSAYTTPPLTTIRQPIVQIGVAAAEGVLEMIKGHHPSLPTLPTALVIRESAAISR